MRENIPGNTEEYFKIIIGIDVLNHILVDLKCRIGQEQLTISNMLGLSLKKFIEIPFMDIWESLQEVQTSSRVFSMNRLP